MSAPEWRIRRAALADVDAVTPLFDAYRQFYGNASDRALAAAFLAARLGAGDSVLFVATGGDASPTLAGFAQIYPTFSSIACAPALILNDLFTVPEERGKGVGSALLNAVRDYGKSVSAAYVMLSTAIDNRDAQRLYESHGYHREDGFLEYVLRTR